MKSFAWLTLITGLTLSGVAAYFSIIGLSLLFAGAFWSVVVLAGTLEISKLVAVAWLYRYRSLAGRWVRTYFFAATLLLMSITSMGIFGYLTRAHVGTESAVATSELTLAEIDQREQTLLSQKTQLTGELATLTTQANQLVTQLGNAERLTGTNGAVSVQRQLSTRREALLKELQQTNTALSSVQKERIAAQVTTQQVTADAGPLRYVAQAVYGRDDAVTIRSAVIILTILLMLVFDPMAIMLLVAANILFMKLAPTTPLEAITAPVESGGMSPTPPPVIGTPQGNKPVECGPLDISTTPKSVDYSKTDIPKSLIR